MLEQYPKNNLEASSVAIDPTAAMAAGEQLGTDNELVRNLARDPDNTSEAAKQTALNYLDQIIRYPLVVTGPDGKMYSGHDYPDCYKFDGNIRGRYDDVPKDGERWNAGMALVSESNIRGAFSRVIIEFEDGEAVMVRRTNDDLSASKQTFDMTSTRQPGLPGKPVPHRELDTSLLKDVVLVPGEYMILGRDAKTGRRPTSQSRITSITAFNAQSEVPPTDPILKEGAAATSDIVQRFESKLKNARKEGLADAVGTEAVVRTVAAEPSRPNPSAQEKPGRTLLTLEELDAQLSENAPKPPDAAELDAKYGFPASESQEYGQLLKLAWEGKLSFDPIENIMAAARTLDRRDAVTGVTDISIPMDPAHEPDPDSLTLSTRLKLAQQTRFARSLGFTAHGKPRIENGSLKLRIKAPGNETPILSPINENHKLKDKAQMSDSYGVAINQAVSENLLAAREFHYLEGVGALGVEKEVAATLQEAEQRGYLLVRIPDAYWQGGASFRRNIAEALGYQLDEPATTPRDKKWAANGSYYELRITGKRPGFSSKDNLN